MVTKMLETARVSVVIVSWNTCNYTCQAVRSALESADHDLDIEVIVSDNGSSDGTPYVLRQQFPRVTVVENGRNLGFAAGVNRGLERATGNYVLILNSDAEVNNRTIRQLILVLEEHSNAAAAASQLVYPNGAIQRSVHPLPDVNGFLYKFTLLRMLRRLLGWHRHLRSLEPKGDAPIAVDYVIGAVLLLRMSALKKIGFFDEDYFFYYEDTDFCRRIKMAGMQIMYCPIATVLHHDSISSEKNYYTITRVYFRSILTYVRKHVVGERSSAFWTVFKVLFLFNLLYDAYKQILNVALRPSRRIPRKLKRLRAIVDFIRYDMRAGLWF